MRHRKLGKVAEQTEARNYPEGSITRKQVNQILDLHWVDKANNLVFLGPPGVGKTWLVCALANAGCSHSLSARYYRVSLLLSERTMTRGDGSFIRLLPQLSKFDLLFLNDWALAPFTADQARDLLEVIDARTNSTSLTIASQIPMNHWHQTLPDPTLADAILDRIMHNSLDSRNSMTIQLATRA